MRGTLDNDDYTLAKTLCRRAKTYGLLRERGLGCDVNASDMIFRHEFFCVGGVTIHGVIGIRDYPKVTTLDKAQRLYIAETKRIQTYKQLTDEQLKADGEHRTNETYWG